MMYSCSECKYTTERSDNYKRHQKSKKHIEMMNKQINNNPQAKHNNSLQNHNRMPEKHNDFKGLHNTSNNEVLPNANNGTVYTCAKCAKQYKGITYFQRHEKKCIGVDILTCPRCMKTFKQQPGKSRHIKNNKCKPRSIFEYKERQNITINNNNNITNNNTQNTINIKNNIFINDYGKERNDYITDEKIMQIVKSCSASMIPKYIDLKHFDPMYPENTNIRFDNNVYLIKKEGDWNNIDGDILATELYNTNKHFIGKYCFENDTKLRTSIDNEDMYERLKDKTDFNTIELKGGDKNIKKNIKSVIKKRYYNKSKPREQLLENV